MSYMPSKAKLLMGSALIKPQDVFAVNLWTGNGATQTITTGLDMAGEGGLVWTKSRSSTASHALFDTLRGAGKVLTTNATDAEWTTYGSGFSSFSSSGFVLGADPNGWVNASPNNYAAWSFRRAKKFFDIVTYTGNGVAGRQIPHNLGVAPGMIVVKCRSAAYQWIVYHSGLSSAETKFLGLNTTNSESVASVWADTAPTSSIFYVGNQPAVNETGQTYVAYLFAQNPDLIDCGSYVGNGSSTGPVVTCGSGWTPQWLMVKRADGVGGWTIYDDARSTANPRTKFFYANTSASEYDSGAYGIDYTSSGFQIRANISELNAGASNYLTCAIRAPV